MIKEINNKKIKVKYINEKKFFEVCLKWADLLNDSYDDMSNCNNNDNNLIKDYRKFERDMKKNIILKMKN